MSDTGSAAPLPHHSGIVRDGEHVLPVRVYYEDTDAGGIVYHASYLRFAERARTEMLRIAGVDQRDMAERAGLGFAVHRVEADYMRPAHLDDALQVHTRLMELKGASLVARQDVRRDDVDLVRLVVRVACIDAAGRPSRLPAAVGAAIRRHLAPSGRDSAANAATRGESP